MRKDPLSTGSGAFSAIINSIRQYTEKLQLFALTTPLNHVELCKKNTMGKKSKAVVVSSKLLERRLNNASVVRNKVLRQALYRKERLVRLKEKKERKKQRTKEREALGDKVSN